MRWLAILVAVAACGAQPDAVEPPVVEDAAELAPAEEPEPVDTCDRVFSPAPELAEATRKAAERWSAATGCAITVADAGMPVELVPEMRTESGELANGRARVFTVEGEFYECRGLIVAATAEYPERTIVHEMGHCLGALRHADDPRSLLHERPTPDAPIDAPALSLVCENLPCETMVPETA